MSTGCETPCAKEAACAHEAIHTPGAIQAQGALIAVQASSGLVTHASANLRMFLGQDAASVLGRPFAEIVDAASCRALMSAEGKVSGGSAFHMVTGPDGLRLQLRAHQTGRIICVDIEPVRSGPDGVSALIQVQSIRDTFSGAASRLELCERAVRGLKEVTGYDRVMAYRFAADGHGEVVAEALEPALPPYLGLHYPAGDIPAQARRLFLQQRVAAIADSSYVPVPILADATLADGTSLDLTYSGLRSPSAVHREYMRNMQTAASLTVALVHEEALWGMLVCHHSTPMVAGPELRAVADSIGHIVSARLAEAGEAENAAGLAARMVTLEALRVRLGAAVPLAAALAAAAPDLLRLVGAGGAVIRCAGALFSLGCTPPLDAAERALGVLHPQVRAYVFAVDDLGLRYPDLTACTMEGSGALLLSLPSAPDDAILWFRPELSRTVLWGGNPGLDSAAKPAGAKHTPRNSFAAWKEIVSGRSSPWTQADLELAGELHAMVEHAIGQRARAELKRLRQEIAASRATETTAPAEPATTDAVDEAFHHLLFDAAPDAMVVVNSAGEIQLVNLQAEKEFGYNGHELTGQPIDLLMPERFRPKHSLNRQLHAADPRIGMSDAGIEPFGRRKDGGEFPVEIVLSDFLTTKGLLVIAAIRNTSVRKNAEKQLAQIDRQNRDLLEASPDVMVMFNPGGEIVLLNHQAAAQFGYQRHELTGRNIETIIPQGLMAHAENVAARSKANAGAASFAAPIELIGLRKNRTEFPAEITVGVAASGDQRFVTAAIRDITIRKELETYTLSTLDELKRSNEELERFALIASHDLQEPLRMVISYTQLLARRYKGKLDADADDFISFAVDGALRLQRLIRDVLAYCKVETETTPLAPASSEDAVQIALSNLRELIKSSGAQITIGQLPMVTADPHGISRVFQNLIANSIKYQTSEIPEVHISAVKNAAGKWLFSVRDNGIGIEPQYFDKIFGMFERLHNREQFAGTGIGLAICKKIIEHHRGTISVQSRLGEGSIFQFTLLCAETRT
jgi:PAS domain S-box-containing protein